MSTIIWSAGTDNGMQQGSTSEYYKSTRTNSRFPTMAFERHRKKLQAEPRQWGDQFPSLPYTPSPPRNRDEHSPPQAELLDPLPDLLPDSLPEGPLEESTCIRIPIPANTTMISTKGWSLNSLIDRNINFHRVPRVSVLSDSLLQSIDDFEKSGVPLVIEGCHKHPKWSTEEFTMDSFVSSSSSSEILVRNVHDWQDTTIPLNDFISKSRSIATFAEEGEQERFYGKDAPCPERWEEWLNNANVVPESLLSGGSQDFFRYRPHSSRVEHLMCYLGVGDTFTPCHKDLCASSGQNLMCHTENGGSSFWFMTESSCALEVSNFFHSLGRELDHEDYVITVEELMKAPFKVYILEQKLGDLVLVPPRSAHQVVNFGGVTVKTSWSRMTLKGLVTAYHHELPIYRRVCRPETYQVKSTIHHVLLGLTSELRLSANKNGKIEERLVSNIQELLVVFDHILAEEESNICSNDPSPDEATCDICGADIFQGFFECRTCVEVDSAEGGYIVCPGCYVEGRSCKHQIMQPMQRRPIKLLLDTRKEAIEVVDTYEKHYGRTLQISNDINNSYLRTFRAALVLLDIYKTKTKSTTKVCNKQVGTHTVPFSSALHCKLCHNGKCFSHILSDRKIHSVEALLLYDSDNTHHNYHRNHVVERKARFGISPLELPPLVYYAINFGYCKPINPRFMELGWYDANVHISDILDDQQSPAEMESTLVPDATVTISVETGPIAVQPRVNNMPELTVKHTKKRRVYVSVPDAPYPLPSPYHLLRQGRQINRKRQENSTTSVPLVTRDELQPEVNKPEQSMPPSQVADKVPKTLSDIGISIPTTVRKPGSFIIHTLPHVIKQSTEHPVEPVNPRPKPPHVGNPVTTQVITKGLFSAHKLKFKKSKDKQTPSSSNDTATVASTDTQGSRNSPNVPQPQPQPSMAIPDLSNAVELLVNTVMEMERVTSKLTSNSHPQQPNGPQYNGPPHHYDSQQHISPPHHFRHYPPQYLHPTVHVHYSPPQQHNDHQRPQHNGPSPYFSHADNSYIRHPYGQAQRQNYRDPPSYPEPQFHQDVRSSPQKRGPVQSPGKTAYVNRSQDHHNAHHNGGNMSGNSVCYNERPNKKRRYDNGRQDFRSQIQPSNRFNLDAQPPRGPRGTYNNSTRPHSSPRRGKYGGMERSTNRGYQQPHWRTEQSEHGKQGGYYRQQNWETNYRTRYASTSIEPEIEQSTQGPTMNNGDPKDDVINSYDNAPFETPLFMAGPTPTVPSPGIEQDDDDGLYSSDSVTITVPDDALQPHEAAIPVDTIPLHTIGEEENPQNWEDNYGEEARAPDVTLSAPRSAPQPASTSESMMESIFVAADDSMDDMTANPWT